eukprot:1148657-Pelagomonas_calceolata.AAC.1
MALAAYEIRPCLRKKERPDRTRDAREWDIWQLGPVDLILLRAVAYDNGKEHFFSYTCPGTSDVP